MLLSPPLTRREEPLETHLDELVRRSRDGDPEAFDALVGRYYRMVFGIAFRMLHAAEPAEDATQEIFIKAWRNLSRFRSASRFTTWLHSIAVRHCLDLCRRRKRESGRTEPFHFHDDGDEVPLGTALTGPGTGGWDFQLSVQEAIEKLPEKLRVVVLLHYLLGNSVDEIARSLKLHPNTVYVRLGRSLERLKSDLGDLEIR